MLHAVVLSHVCVSIHSHCPPTDPGPVLMHCDDSCLYPLTLLNPEESVSQLLVLILVPLVTVVGLELASGECTEVQGERVGGGGGQDRSPVTSSLFALTLPFQYLRLNVTHGLSALQGQDCAFVLFCVYWKTMRTLSCEWGGWPELGVSAGPSTKNVFTKYLSDWVIKLYSFCQRSLYKSVFAKN